jgi:hypothetical protein
MKILLRACLVVCALLAGIALWLHVELKTHRSPTVTTEVAALEDTLDPRVGKQNIKVFTIIKESTGGFDPQDIRTAKVEVSGPGIRVSSLTLPIERTDLVVHSVRLLDVDHDGTKEILLYEEDGFKVAIVWLHDGTLECRPEADILKSLYVDVGPVETDSHLLFVAASEFPSDDIDAVYRPNLLSWSQGQGFSVVTAQYPSYVRAHFVPDLQKSLASESSGNRRKNYERVIKELSSSIE